jgi:hypothetical protein
LLVALGTIWAAVETTALFPKQLFGLTAPLIPKKCGKLRDIGLLAGMLRVCTRARKGICDEWKARNDRDYFACGKGRSPTDVIWRTSVQAEASAASGQTAAALHWDMRAYFQGIKHRRLLDCAKLNGFPMHLARLAIAIYRMPRRLALGSEISDAVYPNQGVLPGDTFADSLIRVYTISPYDSFVRRNPSIDFMSYVDDLQIAACGDERDVLNNIEQAADELEEAVVCQMKASLAEQKSAITASSRTLARKLRSRLGPLAGEPSFITVALGIDFTAGQRRAAMKGRGTSQKGGDNKDEKE